MLRNKVKVIVEYTHVAGGTVYVEPSFWAVIPDWGVAVSGKGPPRSECERQAREKGYRV